MPPSSFEQLLLAWPGSDKQADVLGATSLTQRVWELRYSVPGGRGAVVRGKDGTCAADSLFSIPLFRFEEAGKTWEMKELSAQDGVRDRRRVCSPSSHPCSPRLLQDGHGPGAISHIHDTANLARSSGSRADGTRREMIL